MNRSPTPSYLEEADLTALIRRIEEQDREDWQRFLSYADELQVEVDEVLIRQFERDRDVYILTSGELEVRVAADPDGSDLTIAKISPVAVVGEQSFLDEGARTATVAASKPSTVHRLALEGFDKLCEGAPDLACAFLFDVARSLSLRDRVHQA